MKKFVATIGTLVLASGAAFAQESGEPKSFEDLDKDKNGALTQEEAAADRTIASIFTQADTNQDGYLTQTEYERVMNEKEDAE